MIDLNNVIQESLKEAREEQPSGNILNLATEITLKRLGYNVESTFRIPRQAYDQSLKGLERRGQNRINYMVQ